jgi:hypothetical protein
VLGCVTPKKSVAATMVPMRMVLDSAATPKLPTSILLFPEARFEPAKVSHCNVEIPVTETPPFTNPVRTNISAQRGPGVFASSNPSRGV